MRYLSSAIVTISCSSHQSLSNTRNTYGEGNNGTELVVAQARLDSENMAGICPREAVRVKVKKCEPTSARPEWRKFSVDPQITTLEVLYSLLAKAFDVKSDFSIKYKAFDPAGNEIYLAVRSDWDLDAAFLRIHNISIQTASEPCLILQIDVKPFTVVRECERDMASPGKPSSALVAPGPTTAAPIAPARELMSPLQSLGVSQKYVQHMQTKLGSSILNQMEKTFSIVQKAFNLSEEHMANLPPRPPMCDSEFRLFLDALGQIQRKDELHRVIFLGGIDPSLRRVVWKHLLNVYPGGANGLALDGHQRMEFMRRKSEQYCRLRDTWKAAVKRGSVAGELAYVTSMVKKDVLRTDRLHPFYAGSDDNQNIAALFNILTTYALNHPTVSYCQGMSDIASPLLVTMNDEAQAYICFCAIMARVRGNFMLDGIAMTQKFAHLTEALSFYDPEFWEYLKSQQADDLLFCYRWLLLELKREFPFEDALRMLEVQWSSLRYPSGGENELPLFEKEFVPIADGSMPNSASTFSSSYSATPTSPSYLLTKPRENPYTKVCALRRQSSSASLSSLSSSLGTAGHALDNTKRLNHSLDDNMSRHATAAARRQRRTSSKVHQSLDETKMLALIEGAMDNTGIKLTQELSAGEETEDDDVFDRKDSPSFLETNPFKDDAQRAPQKGNEATPPASPGRAFLCSSSSSNLDEDSKEKKFTAQSNNILTPQQTTASTSVTKPLVQLTKSALGSSQDESDSSSLPETSWSASTAATAIQQAQDQSSYNLQLDLESNHLCEPDDSNTPEQDQDPDQEYYPMTTAMTRELRLEAENLDRQVFGLPFTDSERRDDIEYEKLDKDALDLVEDLKENEIITCPDVSELHMRRRQRLAAKSNSVQQSESHAFNPFIDESQLLMDGHNPLGMRNSSSLPEVILPISTEPSLVEVSPLVEIATNADDESAYARSPQRSTQLNGVSGLNATAAALPPPSEFGGGNAFLMFLCLTLLLQHRNTIMKAGMDYNEIAMHFDKMVRKHDVTRVLNQARRMFVEYLKAQSSPQRQRSPNGSVSNGSTGANLSASMPA
ncbi:TBC1 domain family member 25 isoform X3 [Drosophila biarmipes]|uniref:TBC1 domain family member 25 isoform X3 n=1 Tax=Drosophila biarmipes TaxID=125945 RepID=UPI0007E791FC|nr:TBC1 domain family member 25 isoform X3 [Drosophila biarmipes]